MTDPTAPAPIVVSASPLRDQIAAGLRQFVTVWGPVVTILAATGWGQKIGLNTYFTAFAGSIGAISTIAAVIIGQLKTRQMAQTAAAMAAQLPDSIATTR